MELNYKFRKYKHFDLPISNPDIQKKIINKLNNPLWVASHGFYPFIYYPMKSYHKVTGKKERKILYASHIDSLIYEHYSNALNEKYNTYLENLDIDECIVAYRTVNDRKVKSNIEVSHDVFKFIYENNNCSVCVIDFKDYFDTINHLYLKEMLCKMLNCSILPKDIYKVFLSVTKYSYIDKLKITELLKENKNSSSYFSSASDFREFKKIESVLESNNYTYGIPQGTPISALLSNIYLIEFDYAMHCFVKKHKGIYRRYCDDLIVAFPKEECLDNNFVIDGIKNEIKKINTHIVQQDKKINSDLGILKISNSKMHLYEVKDGQVNEITLENDQKPLTFIDYLGFTFDGKYIKIRDKSIFKYYKKLYKTIFSINQISFNYNRNAYRKMLYNKFTNLRYIQNKKIINPKEIEISYKGRTNFIKYAIRADLIFRQTFNDNCLIKNQIRNYWRKINQYLYCVKK